MKVNAVSALEFVPSATKRIPDQVGDDKENNSLGACALGLFLFSSTANSESAL